MSKKDAAALRKQIKEDINYDEGQHEAYRTINDFSHKVGEEAYWRKGTREIVELDTPKFRAFQFQDIFEWRWEDYTYHYVWCCYALAWGILKYDAMKVEAA